MKKIIIMMMFVLGLAAVSKTVMPVREAHAQISGDLEEATSETTDQVGTLGPFKVLVKRLLDLFYSTRNLIYIATGFVFLQLGMGWIKNGSIEWDKIGYIMVALAILVFIGIFINWAIGDGANSEGGVNIVNTIEGTE